MTVRILTLALLTPAASAHEMEALCPEFVATSKVANDQHHVWVDCDDAGNFAIAYSTGNIFGRRLDRDGNPLGTDFQVNETWWAGDQNECYVARDPVSGDFVVCYSDWDGNDGDIMGAYARFYRANGTPYGPETHLNVTTVKSQFEPHAAFSPSGRVMVVWSDAGLDGSCGVMARLYERDGSPVTGEFLVNTPNDATQIDPSVACSRDGLFVVAFVDASGQTGAPREVLARLFDDEGNPIASQFLVNSASAGMQRDPIVAMDADGDFVVVWQDESGTDGSGYGVYARLFDRNGAAKGSQFAVPAQSAGNQRDPHVAMDYVGNFVVTWESDAAGTWDVLLRRFDRNGQPLTGDTRVHEDTAGDQTTGKTVLSQSGERLVTVWHDTRGGGDCYARVFDARAIRANGIASLTNSVTLDLEVPGMGGELYFLLPSHSLTGANQAIEVNGARILNLAADSVMLDAAAYPESVIYSGLAGTLDGQGRAQATFTIPNDASYYGLPVYFAAITLSNPLDTSKLAQGLLEGVGFMSDPATVLVDGPKRFHPGQILEGEIADVGEEDRGTFEALKGEKVTIVPGSVPEPLAATAAHAMRLEVVDADGKVVKSWTGTVPPTGKKKKAFLKFKVKKHGTYFLRVLGDDEASMGNYLIETSHKVKKAALPSSKKKKVKKSGEATTNFLAVSSSTLDLAVAPLKQGLPATGAQLVGPTGVVTDLAPWTTIDGTSLVVAGVPLSQTGKYIVVVSGPPKTRYQIDVVPTPPSVDAPIVLE